MGFFDVIGRLARGEPGFQDDATQPASEPGQTSSNPQETSKDSAIRKGDDTTFPVVHLKQLKPHTNGTKLELYCQIENKWSEEVELDKIHLFNTKRELDTLLRPGEVREFLVYSGPVLAHEYHEAQLDYKTRDGDYFSAVHEMKFMYNDHDKTYLPSEAHIEEPIRDIYG